MEELKKDIDWESILKFMEPKAPLFLPANEQPSPKQKAFLRVDAKEALFGGAAGGGKSSALLMAALQYVDVPGYSAILFRRTFADLNLPGALMDRFRMWMQEYPEVHWNGADYVATFPSGARITFGYLANSDHHLRYQGSEFQFIGMDEVTHIRQTHYQYLISRLRRPANGPLSQVPLRMRSASNPEANWVRDYFISEGKEHGRIFIPSFMDDNPGLDVASYRDSLSKLDPVTRQKLEFGDWWSIENGSMFKREAFLKIARPQIPSVQSSKKIVRFWDLAGTEPSEMYKDPDWTVGTLAMIEDGVVYILNIKRCRKNAAGVEAFIKETAEADGRHVAIRMEQEPGSSGKGMIDRYARNVLLGYDFKGIRSSGDKVTRAKPMSAAVANGNVYVLESSPWLGDYLDEMSSFPESFNHDDQVDSSTGAFNYLSGLGHPQRRPLEIIV